MKKSKKVAIFVILTMFSGVMFGGYIVADAAGTTDDPLISLSYLNDVVVPQITQTIQSNVAQIAQTAAKEAVASEVIQQTGTSFNSVQVFAGQTIIGKAGTELILRVGSAAAVCPGDVGLVDTTQGLDLTNQKAVAANHVYIIPRADGRGILMASDGYIMIKGGYDILQ